MGHMRRTNGIAAKLELGKREKKELLPSSLSPSDKVDDGISYREREARH